MSDRLTGQDVTVQVFEGQALQDELDLMTEITVTFEMSVTRQDYLGKKRQMADGKFDIVKVEFSSNSNSAAWIDFVDKVVKRQMREPGAPDSFSVSCNLIYPNGEIRSIVCQELEFESIPISVTARKDMVENGFTAYANDHQFVN